MDTAAALTDTCNINHVTRDVAVVQEEVDAATNRWLKAKELAEERKEQILETQKVVKKFQNVIKPYEDSLKNCEKVSKKPRELGSDPENVEKYLTKLKVSVLWIQWAFCRDASRGKKSAVLHGKIALQ